MAIRLIVALTIPAGADAQVSTTAAGDSINIRLINTELRAAIQVLSQYLDRPVLFGGAPGTPVTFETPVPVPRGDVLRLLRGLVESQGLELFADSAAGMYRVRPREAPRQERSTSVISGRPPLGVELFVLPMKHARAVDVASTVNALYGRGVSATDGPGRVSTLSEDLRGNLMPPAGAPPVAPAAGGGGNGGGGRPATLSGELTIVADSRANSLLVRANAQDIELIRAVVEALDVRPLQVLIEVLVAEVRRDRSLGINMESVLQPTDVGKLGATAGASLGTGGLGDFALSVMGIGGLDLDATLRLAAGRGTVRILTRPVLLATNNQLAEIVVGSQRPFVQVQRSLPTDAASRDQIVQYKDVGTKLTVRPTISSDGSVQLEVTQEVSTATAEVAFNAPVIGTRSLRTQLLVRDGQTVALGGLTDRVKESRQSGIPLLSAIPFIGGLFGGAKWSTVETELFVFLTPRVIRTDDDAMRLTAPMRAKSGVIP